jgi:hypothetical protein
MSENGTGIGKAILEVMGSVGFVQKQGAKGLNYTYASESALIAALRPAMIEAGVFCYIQELPSIEQLPYVTSKGTAMNRTIAHGVVRFVHPESGTHIDVHAMGEGADVGDKAGNKAATGLLKYALRQTFLIETGDDPDQHSSAEQERMAPAPTENVIGGSGSRANASKSNVETDWPSEFVDELKAQGIVKQKNHAVSLLNLSPFDENTKIENVMRWANIYRARREDGLKTNEAASVATEEYWVSK